GDDDDDDKEVVRDDDKDDEKDDKEKGGDDEHKYDKETRDEESFDPIPKTPENDDDKGNGEEDIGLNVGREEGHEEEEDELYKDVNTNQGRGIQATLEVEDLHVTLTPINPDGMESIFETTSQMDAHTPTSVAPLPMTASTMTPFTIATITTTSQAPILPTIALRTIIQDLPNFGSLTKRNDEFLKSVDANIQKIIKEQVKEQVKVQVFKILPRIEHTVNEQLEAEVLTRLSHSLKTSYAVATDFSEMELKKILIEKMKGNKSIQRSDEQQNLYKALVEAYESNKIILHTYGETVTLKRRHDDDADKDEEPFAGPDWGSKRRRDGKEPEDDDKLYKFKEGDFKRLRIQDIKDMLLLLVQGKLTNLTVEERFAFNHKEAYTTYSNPRGFIYKNKDKKNMLIRIDELHKFSDGTLTDVRTALDDRLKEIRMQYLP
nr:hypothetical protein [Tanacetum cinerariifolium]